MTNYIIKGTNVFWSRFTLLKVNLNKKKNVIGSTKPAMSVTHSLSFSLSLQAAERDWEEKRASLTQYSAQDINRLLEETQAELMKAIPDLDFAAKQIKPVQNQHQNQNQNINQCDSLSSPNATPEHKPNKPQHPTHKISSKEASSRRGSDELLVPRYRTEKPSKSPPPPPPRRSFPTSPGLTTRSGEVISSAKTMKVILYIRKTSCFYTFFIKSFICL